MGLPKHVTEHIRSIILNKKLMGRKRINYLTIVNEIERKFSIELTENEILIVREFKDNLVEALNSWAPALREIRSAVTCVKVPSEPREYYR